MFGLEGCVCDWLYEFERRRDGWWWLGYLFMGWCSFKHINGEEERTNKCVICLVAGRKREKERKRKRDKNNRES